MRRPSIGWAFHFAKPPRGVLILSVENLLPQAPNAGGTRCLIGRTAEVGDQWTRLFLHAGRSSLMMSS
jgi:hypothetical protein